MSALRPSWNQIERSHHWCTDSNAALFGLQLSKKILKITDNLSRTLQHQAISAAKGQAVAELTVCTLKGMHTEESCLFFDLVDCFRTATSTDPPVLPCKRRAAERYEIGSGEASYSTTLEEHYCCQYYEALDIAVTIIMTRFDQPEYAMYRSLESLLVQAANGQEYDRQLDIVTALYKADFDQALLSTQLQNLGTWFADGEPKKMGTVSLAECVAFLQGLSQLQKSFFCEVCRLAKLILVMPATNAVSKRSFSAMRHLKTAA